jgi:hypothetical protein
MKMHSVLIYPLIFLFSYTLKGKKTNYKNFFHSNKKEKLLFLNITYNKFDFLNKIKYFFDKKSSLYDKTNIIFNLEINKEPEVKDFNIFDFKKKINLNYSSSMLSARVSNDNLYTEFKINDKLDKNNSILLLRYCLLAFASRQIDYLFLDEDIKTNPIFSKIYKTINLNLENATFINFSNSKDLYVITCEKDNKKFDIIWLSTNREIELTDFKKVYDKFGNLLEENIKINICFSLSFF